MKKMLLLGILGLVLLVGCTTENHNHYQINNTYHRMYVIGDKSLDAIDAYYFLKTKEYLNKSCEDLFLDCWDGEEQEEAQVCIDIHNGCYQRNNQDFYKKDLI